MNVNLEIRGGRLFGITVVFLLTCVGCGDVTLPAVTPQKIDNAVDAKKLARQIAGQKCRYYRFKDLGIDDYAARQFYCERGIYTLESGQTHQFVQQFYSFKGGEEVKCA